jgi:hypothetical protein
VVNVCDAFLIAPLSFSRFRVRPCVAAPSTASLLFSKASKLVHMGFSSASQINEQRQNIVYVQTGSAEIDKMLGGELNHVA